MSKSSGCLPSLVMMLVLEALDAEVHDAVVNVTHKVRWPRSWSCGLVFSTELHCLLHHAISFSLRQAVHLVSDVDLLGLARKLICCAHIKDATCGHQFMDKGLASNSSKS